MVRSKKISALYYMLLTVGMVIFTIPMIYLVSYSLRDNSAIYHYPPTLFPTADDFTFNNFVHILSGNQMIYRYLVNSLFVTITTVTCIAIISSLLAYGLGRFTFPGRKMIFGLILGTMTVPGLVLILPQFEMAIFFHFLDKHSGLILIYIAWNLPFSTFMIKGFIEHIPKDYDNSILIDGGNYFTIYRHIIFPLAKPAIAATTVFNFLTVWEEYPWALTVINEQSRKTFPIFIAGFFGRHNFTQYGYIFAVSVISLVPILLIYISMQKYFQQGLTAGGIKG